MAMRWKKNPRPTGLRAAGAGPQGSTLRDGDKEFARAYALRRQHQTIGWYWVARNDAHGVPHENTCNEPVADEATAKADALAYVRKHLVASKAQSQQKEQA